MQKNYFIKKQHLGNLSYNCKARLYHIYIWENWPTNTKKNPNIKSKQNIPMCFNFNPPF